jgi:FtsP/CotA-like multicopper oxidase with cupredoxin domain
VKFRYLGTWLFHCYVVSHAHAGLLGVFIVAQ